MAISMGKKVAGFALAGAALMGGAGAMAWAENGTTGTTATPAADLAAVGLPAGAKAAAGGAPLGALRRADHGSIDVKDGDQWVTVVFDRGRVSDVAADHITLARPDGKSVTLKLTADTKYRGATSASDVQKDQPALVVSNSDGTARLVAQPKPGARGAGGGGAGRRATTTTTA